MKITVFEGTPEEYKQVADVLGGQTVSQQSSESTTSTQKVAYLAMLRRAPILAGQKDLYRILAKGEISKRKLYELMGRTPEQMRGVLGALGRRIAGTEEIGKAGLAESLNAVVDWNKSGDDTISLKPAFLEVLQEEGIV